MIGDPSDFRPGSVLGQADAHKHEQLVSRLDRIIELLVSIAGSMEQTANPMLVADTCSTCSGSGIIDHGGWDAERCARCLGTGQIVRPLAKEKP